MTTRHKHHRAAFYPASDVASVVVEKRVLTAEGYKRRRDEPNCSQTKSMSLYRGRRNKKTAKKA